MLIEKVNENQIEIILNSNDLSKRNISVHSFMCNSEESKNLFSNILNFANREIDFNEIKYKIITETFFIPSKSSFIMLITRVPKKSYLHLHTNILKSFKFKHNFWLDFSCLDNFCMFCVFLKFDFAASLYLLNGHYFLHIHPKNLKQYFRLLNIASEFSEKIHNNNFILDKNAKCIIKNCAIQTAQKYFI